MTPLIPAALLFVFGLLGSAPQSGARPPSPKLPIDCGFSQPCTGTTCINQQTSYLCTEDGVTTEYFCQNDTQYYSGGDKICCTGKNFCGSCVVNGKTRTYYSYNGVQSSCVPNY